ncbi:hypothetical protein H9Y04_14730 [Streptomyces sp. TRM66268-LWL]|uniref:Adenylyl-sulfate kinase n=1 Tax=Streptomyces polyasparticus TaxID=2767826 RepID=A0ABR7SF55_9ACTN|nr:hypothetical protein [Streptomyces polyasparticus]MBC9713824.1 hypothetical protein [Streptomyces polyasparticus]
MIDSSRTRAAVLLTGTVGVGKTSVADAVGDRLAEAGVPHGVVDLDRLCQVWPAPEGDPFNSRALLRNLRAVAVTYLDGGARRLVLAGVAEDQGEVRELTEAVGVPLTVCRLEVELAVVHDRLRARHAGDPAGLRWHLDRSGELAGILDAAQVADCSVDATHRPVAEVAEAVLRAVGWA